MFYSMGEVSEMFDVKPSLLRHWETQFSVLKPKRNKKGNRLYTPADVENLKLIYHLVRERGMTLDGAKKALKSEKSTELERDAELLERLLKVRSLLEDVRQELKDIEEEQPHKSDKNQYIEMKKETFKGPEINFEEHEPQPEQQTLSVEESVQTEIEDQNSEEAAVEGQPTAAKRARKGRGKNNDAEDKELFAYFEQSLF